MKVLVAGATGAIGKQLVPMLVEGGHEVTGMIRSESSAAGVRALGADVVLADGLDAGAVRTAVASVQRLTSSSGYRVSTSLVDEIM